MKNEWDRRILGLLCIIGVVLFCFSPAYSLEKQIVMVESHSIKEQVGHFNYGGKSFITIGDNQESILIGHQSYKNATFQNGEVRTILMQKGVGKDDDWIGKYKGGVYKLDAGKAVLVSSLEYRDVFFNGKEKTYLMKKEIGTKHWQVTLGDGKVYTENSERKLIHSGYEELRRVVLNGSTLYLIMKKSLKPNSFWECEYDKTILRSK